MRSCPGCEIDRRKAFKRPPYKLLTCVWIIVLCNALSIYSLFPFLYFMIKEFGIAKEDVDIGVYAGFVGCSFMVGRALTSIFWGVVSDTYGRKPVIITGTAAVVIFNTLFGLSTNFWMAISSRFLLGSLNGLLGPIKAYASEICREEHQPLAMSVVSIALGIGLIVGPALGGFLAQPAEKYPHLISQDSIFGRYAYFLPCFVISSFAAVVTIGAFWLPESLHNHQTRNFEDVSSETVEGGHRKEIEETSKASLWKNWPLMSSIIVYCIFSLHNMAYAEVFSLWAVSPRNLGGLSYTSKAVGLVLAITGGGTMIFQLLLYPYMIKILGPVVTTRVCGILSVPVLQSYPFIAMLSGFSLVVVLDTASVVKYVLSICVITSTTILQNRAVDQNQRGAANGIAMTGMSLFKALGPACGGALLSWSEKRQDATFLPGPHMIFAILNFVQLVGVIWTFKPLLVERNNERDLYHKVATTELQPQN